MSCVSQPTIGACGYPAEKTAFNGPLVNGDDCINFVTGPTTPYAHRCHQITGVSPDDTIRFRWRSSSDRSANYAGFYLDDVAVTNVRLPNSCTPDTCAGQSNGTACDDGNGCTSPDACAGGACAGTPTPPPPEALNVRVQADKTTYFWDPLPGASRYDVIRGALGSLPVGPGGSDEVCFGDLPTPDLVDATPPAPGTGFWYLSRGETACSIGTYGTQSNATPRTSTTCP